MLRYIETRSEIKEGGSEVFKYQNQIYLISVASLSVGSKSEQDCKKVGTAKARKEMLAYVNGSEISSYTELVTTEEETSSLQGTQVEYSQKYTEVIKEKVAGTINMTIPLGGWYSEDRSVYYFAIYKLIEE